MPWKYISNEFLLASILMLLWSSSFGASATNDSGYIPLRLGSYSIGQNLMSDDSIEHPIHSVSVEDHGNNRDLVYLNDTLVFIQTKYPGISDINYESSQSFLQMLNSYKASYGNSPRVYSDNLAVNSDLFSGRSTRKVWQWDLPNGRVQLIATVNRVNKEYLRLMARAQAQEFQKTNPRYRNRSVSDIEEQGYIELTGAINSTTSFTSKVWGFVSGRTLGQAIYECKDEEVPCVFANSFGPTQNHFTDIDAPKMWYNLSGSERIVENQHQNILGKSISYKQNVQVFRPIPGVTMKSRLPITDKSIAKQLISPLKPILRVGVFENLSHADSQLKAQIVELMCDMLEPQLQAAMASPELEVTIDTPQVIPSY